MSTKPQTFRERVAGKWQVPLLAVALGLLAVTVVVVRRPPHLASPDEVAAELREMADALLLEEAEQLARAVVVDERYAELNLAPVYGALADVMFRQQARRNVHSPERVVEMLATYEQAEALGAALSGDAFAQCGEAYGWLGQYESAIKQYERALRAGPTDDMAVRQALVTLRIEHFDTPADALLEALAPIVEGTRERPEVLVWAIEHAHELLLQLHRDAEAEGLLDRHEALLPDPDHRHRLAYLRARGAFHAGRADEAEIALRHLLGDLEERDGIFARANWLLGRIILRDDGPQRPLRAISFFENVLNAHVDGPYVVAARLGMAEALSQLERYDDALHYYQRVLDDLPRGRSGPAIDLDAVRASLTLRSRLQRAAGHHDSALAYLQLATSLVDPAREALMVQYLTDLSTLKSNVAEMTRDRSATAAPDEAPALAERSRDLFRSAGDDYLALRLLLGNDIDRAAQAQWDAAVMFDAGGDRRQAVRLFEDFLERHREHDLVPQALFRLAQAHQADGELEQAVARYQQCIREHTRTSPAQDAIIPLADCFIMMGPDRADQAEQTLLSVVDDPPDNPAMFTPDSLIYRSALFRLGDLYSREGRYEDAIARLDEALQRYPDDGRAVRGTFLLADAYRKSGLALDRAVAEAGNFTRREEMLRKKRDRLAKAETLFGEVIERFHDIDITELDGISALQRMLSYHYRADCAFDLGDFQSALDRYQEVVRVYAHHPVALPAYMQVISCLESLGRVADIPPALRRAQFLARRLDGSEHDPLLSSRAPADWDRLFAWLGRTGNYQ